ncbi:YktB family protein [Alkalihalobacillus sp. 1P02AB]|uniref:YktB family protein n=1 Tax=Alkalihalobacillus sp. 1P02AB TaxID=3132260 RepID=UPI0039A594D4
MTFSGFNDADFNVFNIKGLEERMNALKSNIRPKFEAIATEMEPTLSSLTGDEMFTHIAKHARRTVNPPNDTWVAFASSKRGYKMLPHFQVGLFETHLFVWFAVIYECPNKAPFAEKLLKNVNKWKKEIPNDFVWSIDHMKPEAKKHGDLSKNELEAMFTRLKDVKKAELLCGIHIDRNDPILKDGQALIQKIEETYKTVLPLYTLAQNAPILAK